MLASIPNKEELLLPGTFVEVTLSLGSAKPLIAVEQTAITYEAGMKLIGDTLPKEEQHLVKDLDEIKKLLHDPSFHFIGPPLMCAWGSKPE